MRRRLGGTTWVAVAAAMASLLAATGVASAAPSVTLAPLPNAAHRLTAYGGYAVFSEYQPSSRIWRLRAWHGGALVTLPVPARPIPFDAEAGPGVGGAPTVVYSRCAHDPIGSRAELGGLQYVARPDWTDARGCRIYELALAGGAPRLVAAIRPGRASDATPAIWYGDIAFARVQPGSRTSTIYYWHHTGGQLARLGGGRPPCTVACLPGPRASWVGGMSLDGQVLAFEWSTNAPPFGEGPFPEIRADPLRFGHQSGPSQVIEEAFGSGACGFSEGRTPSVLAAAVSYATVFGDCGLHGGGAEEVDSSFDNYSASSKRWQRAPGGASLVVALAQERGATYWIGDRPTAPASAPPPSSECTPGFIACFEPAFEYSSDCATAHGRCALMRTANPGYGRSEVRHPGSLG